MSSDTLCIRIKRKDLLTKSHNQLMHREIPLVTFYISHSFMQLAVAAALLPGSEASFLEAASYSMYWLGFMHSMVHYEIQCRKLSNN